jgi:hypothetical protein
MEIEFSRQIWKKNPISNIMEVGPEEGDLFLADVQTDRHDDAKNVSRNFANAPKKAFEYRLEGFQLSKYSKCTLCITR